jgi:hypothetical protein
MARLKRCMAWLAALATSSCALNPLQFQSMRTKLSNLDVCRTWVQTSAGPDRAFELQVRNEAVSRLLDFPGCQAMVEKADNDTKLALGAILLVGLAVAAAKSGGGGGGPAEAVDLEWDWDLFYNEYRQLVWACRGVQTGQFADAWRCAGKAKVDTRWPGLQAR